MTRIRPRATIGEFLGDVRHLLLAVIAASIIASATTPSRSLVLLAAVLAVPDVARRHDWWPELWAAAFAFTLWASVIWSENRVLSERVSMDQIIVAGMFAVFRVAITDRRALLLIGCGYLAGCLLLVRDLLRENVAASLSLHSTGSRYSLEGVNQNYIAFTLVGGIAVAILLAHDRRALLPGLVAVGVVCWAGILLNDTRAALIAAVAATVWTAVLVPLRRVAQRALAALVAVVLALAFAIFTGLADERLRGALAGASERETGDLNGRLDFWPIARDLFAEHPWLGSGAGAVTGHTPHGVFAHNVFLDVGTSAGLLGIAVLLGALYVVAFRATREAAGQRRYVLIGVLVCAISAPLLSGYWYQTAPLWLLFAVFSRIGVLEPRGDSDVASAAVPALAGVEPVARPAAATTPGTEAASATGAGHGR